MTLRNRRKINNYLFMNRLQLKIASVNLCYILMVVGIILVVFMNPFYSDIIKADSPCDQRFFASIFMLLVKRFIPAVILLGIVAFVHQLLLTHKICGPLVNFNHTFQRMTEKDLTRKIRLRQNDFLRDEAQLINQSIDALNEGITGLQQSNNQALEALKAAGKFGLSDTQREFDIEKAQAAVAKTKDLLNQFLLREQINSNDKK